MHTTMDGRARTGRASAMLRSMLVVMAALTVAVLGDPRAANAQLAVATRPGINLAGLVLIEEHANVVIDRQHATTTLRHVYHNTTGSRTEGTFAFAAGDGANVDGFAYWNGKQKIVGEVLEIQAAREVYERTVSRQRDPGLLEKSSEGRFSFKIFPIEPEEKKRVEIRVDQWLERRNRVVEYRLPLADPRSEVEIDIVDDRPIRRVRSTTHTVHVKGDGQKRVRVLVGPARGPQDGARELVLQYELGDGHFQASAWVHKDAGQPGYFALTVAAPRVTTALSQDITLVIDGSSTDGGVQARAAALTMLDRLRAADRVNVVASANGPSAASLYPSPRWVTGPVREEAKAFVAAIDTRTKASIPAALRAALAGQENTPRNRTVVLLTGPGPRGRELVDAAAKDALDTRVFVLGFGGVERAALSSLAAAKRGRFSLVENASVVTERVERLAHQIAAPVLVDLALEADGAEVAQIYPRTLPDLYQEQELRIVGRIQGKGPARLVLSGRAGERVELVAKVDVVDGVRHPSVGKLWGRERIAHLLEEIALSGETAARRDETTELALSYNVVTPYTAFLAMPESELSEDTLRTLTSARARKQAMLRDRPDALALLGEVDDGSGLSQRAPMAPSPVSMDDSSSMDGAGSADAPDSIRGGGCAGCTTAQASDAPYGALLLGIFLFWRRRR